MVSQFHERDGINVPAFFYSDDDVIFQIYPFGRYGNLGKNPEAVDSFPVIIQRFRINTIINTERKFPFYNVGIGLPIADYDYWIHFYGKFPGVNECIINLGGNRILKKQKDKKEMRVFKYFINRLNYS